MTEQEIKLIIDKLNQATLIPCINIKLQPDSLNVLSIFDSKVGGIPYWPYNLEYPCYNNNKLVLLAQINCEELPKNNYLPNQGMLQFFINDDDLYGLNLSDQTKQNTFKVIYHLRIDKNALIMKNIPVALQSHAHEDILAFNQLYTPRNIPIFDEMKMTFELNQQSISVSSYNFEKQFKETATKLAINIPNDSIYNIIPDTILENLYNQATGHKLFGYPFFTQYDPRKNNHYDTLLLQLDTEYINNKAYLMFGDSGVINFFINHEKLNNLDFSDVLYNWDCY